MQASTVGFIHPRASPGYSAFGHIDKMEESLDTMKGRFGNLVANFNNASDTDPGKWEPFICVDEDKGCKGGFSIEEWEKFIKQVKEIKGAQCVQGV